MAATAPIAVEAADLALVRARVPVAAEAADLPVVRARVPVAAETADLATVLALVPVATEAPGLLVAAAVAGRPGAWRVVGDQNPGHGHARARRLILPGGLRIGRRGG